MSELKMAMIPFYTYTPKSEKFQTFLLKGLSKNTDIEEIRTSLQSVKNINFIKIEKFKTSISEKKTK